MLALQNAIDMLPGDISYNPFFETVITLPEPHYAGFVPNSVFFKHSPSAIIVYAVAQHLSFHYRKVTPKTIKKIAINLSIKTITNCLSTLKKDESIKKDSDGIILFNNTKTGKIVGAREIYGHERGYFISVNHLKDEEISPQEVVFLSIMSNLCANKKKSVGFKYISMVSKKSRSTVIRGVKNLHNKGYLNLEKSEGHETLYSVNFKRKEVNNMMDRKNKFPENDTPNPPENDTPINNNSSILDKVNKVNSTNDAIFEISKNNNLLFLKDVISNIEEKIKNHQESVDDLSVKNKELSASYTNACSKRDLSLMNTVRDELSTAELSLRRAMASLDAEKSKVAEWDCALKINRGLPISQADINRIGSAIKHALPDYECRDIKKKVFCLVFNSLIFDLKIAYYDMLKGYRWDVKFREKLAMDKAISNCICKLLNKNYRLNRDVFYDKKAKAVENVPQDRFYWLN